MMNLDDNHADGMDWLEAELEDMLNEDYELEMSEPALSIELRRIYKKSIHPRSIAGSISGLC
jgi:hypothetical protein